MTNLRISAAASAAMVALAAFHGARAAEVTEQIAGAGTVPLGAAQAHTFPGQKDEKKVDAQLRAVLVKGAEEGKNDFEGSDVLLYIEGVKVAGVPANQLVLVQVFLHDATAKDVSSDHYVGELSVFGPHLGHENHGPEEQVVVFELSPKLRKELAGDSPAKVANLSITFFPPYLPDIKGKMSPQKGTLSFKRVWLAEDAADAPPGK